MACVLPNSTTVILSWKLINTTVRTLLPSLWSKQWNRKTRCHFLTDLNRQGWTPHITSAGRLHYTALGSARATEILIFTEPARTHTEKSIFQCTQQNRRQSWDQLLGPASLGWGGGGGLEETMPGGEAPRKPGRGQINNQVCRGRTEESGEKDPWG